MVRGLDLFRVHFQNYADRYILIGGAACDLAMSEAGLQFRVTKDLDIVLVVEALDAQFAKALWAFVAAGGYQAQQKSTGEKQFYRFHNPANQAYPFMLELFSRQPDMLQVAQGSHLTPLPVDKNVSSLSAILMDDGYYQFVRSGRIQAAGLPVLDAAHLVPLKARAWLDLTRRAALGEKIDSRTIKKHKNDVFRLFQILDPTVDPAAPDVVKGDLREFVMRMKGEDVDLKALGLGTATRDEVLAQLAVIYHLG